MSEIAAFFDMDHTIIWENSGHSSVKLARREGLITTRHLRKGLFKIILYRLALLDVESWYEQNIALLAGLTPADMDRFASRWFDDFVRAVIYREAWDLIREHRRRGHRVVIITNSPPFFAAPVARALQVEDVISSRVEVRDGRYTGRLIRPLCYGAGKRDYAAAWAREQGLDLEQAFFYTDSRFDLALLKAVGHPVAVNPDLRLRAVAAWNGWPIMDFRRIPAFAA